MVMEIRNTELLNEVLDEPVSDMPHVTVLRKLCVRMYVCTCVYSYIRKYVVLCLYSYLHIMCILHAYLCVYIHTIVSHTYMCTYVCMSLGRYNL